MRFDSWDALKKEAPFYAGAWDQDKLKEYLIQTQDSDCGFNFTLHNTETMELWRICSLRSC